MNISPNQIRYVSTPKPVKLVSGAGKLSSPMASTRVTPTTKTVPKIYMPPGR